MLTLPLAPTDDRANPIFKDVAGCNAWLAQFQMTNLQRAHGVLLTQINELNNYAMPSLERLAMLEALRETVGYLQHDMAKKLIALALPLSDTELQTFVAITQLWQAMVTGYQRCLQAFVAGDKKLAEQGALLCDRCLQYTGLAIFEHLRAGYECNPKLWYQLHNLYAFVEAQSLAERAVSDAVLGHSSTCRNRYLKILLACYARPAELSRSQLQLLERWLDVWSNDLRVENKCSRSKGDAQPLALDLAGKQGLQPIDRVAAGGSIRYIAVVPLSKLLRVKLILLQQGAGLEELGLGELPSHNVAIELLNFLHRCWCEDQNSRLSTRQETWQAVSFAANSAAIVNLLAAKLETSSEVWRMDNESLMGTRITRTTAGATRLHLNQLVAVQKNADDSVKLASVAWLHISVLGQLQIGLNYLPGVVEAVTLPTLAVSGERGKIIPVGFLLAEMPTLRTPASLIIPRNIFKPSVNLSIERANAVKQTLKLGFSVMRGVDYERVSFTLV
jgi:cyclic-di-GMP-binding protein